MFLARLIRLCGTRHSIRRRDRDAVAAWLEQTDGCGRTQTRDAPGQVDRGGLQVVDSCPHPPHPTTSKLLPPSPTTLRRGGAAEG